MVILEYILKGEFMKKEVKSQAALEFLTTYAWAFLVILIMIGALAYFGVLSPSKLLPDRCNFGSEISCSDFSITDGTAGTVNLRLKNNVGESIKIAGLKTTESTGIVISTESGVYSCDFKTIKDSAKTTIIGATAQTYTWNSGDVIVLTYDTCLASEAGFDKGDKAKVLVTIKYYLSKSGSTFIHEVAGEVFTTVTATTS